MYVTTYFLGNLISGLIKNSAHEVNHYCDVLASETKVDFYEVSKLNVLDKDAALRYPN